MQPPSLDTPRGAANPPSLEEREVLRLLRVAASIGVLLFAWLFADRYGAGETIETLSPLAANNLAALLAAALFLTLTFTSGFARYRNLATLAFGCVLIALFIRESAIAADPRPRLLAMMFFPLAAAAFAGWGPRWQLGMNLASLAAFAGTELWMVPPLDVSGQYRWLWLLAALAIAQAAASFLDRRKQDLDAERRAIEEGAERRERRTEGIAHDIRSPLAALSGFVSLLRDADLGEEEKSKALARIESVARRIALLVDNIVELGRLDSGKPEPAGGTAHPDAIAAEVARGWAEEAASKGVTMRTGFACGSCPEANRAHLERIFSNLLASAVARTASGEIRFTTSWREGCLIVEVSGDGPPLGPAEAARIFERPDSYEAGIGAIRLGLYVARTLIEAHGGKIEAEPARGGGLILVAEIPIAR